MGACMRISWPGPAAFAIATVLAVLVAGGCRSSPWMAGAKGDRSVSQNASPTQAPSATGVSQRADVSWTPRGAAGAGWPGQGPGIPSVEELLDQITQVEQLEPAARQRLEADLRQTDPALWPAVVQAFRAALAYRRQREQGQRGAEGASPPALASSATAGTRFANAAAPGDQPPRAGGGTSGQGPKADSLADPSDRPAEHPLASCDPSEGPPAGEGQPSSDQQGAGQRGPLRAGETAGRGTSTADSTKGKGPQVESAGYMEGRETWREHLAAALAALEAEVREAPESPELADKHARLRLLALVAGQREEALRPLPAVPSAVQDFWRQELYGLAVWLDSQRQEDPVRRAGEARQQLAHALVPLGWVAPLVLRNLAFITQVQSYGDYKPFARYEFAPEQEVLLYVEIENFASEETPKGFHTVLEASYRIFDSRNQQVAEKQLGTTEEYCRNPRRDFFVVYHLRMPKRIYTGRHTLQLTVVDQKSKKVGQASVEFTIHEPSS